MNTSLQRLLFIILLLLTSQVIHPATVEISIIKFKFQPQEVSINAGDKIRWVNREKRQYHSVWFENQGDPEPDYLFPGEIYERIFKTSGNFPYRCGPHPEMTGIVHVK